MRLDTVEQARSAVRRRLTRNRGIVAELEPLSMEGASKAVGLLEECVVELSRRAKLSVQLARQLDLIVVQSAFPAFECLRAGELGPAADLLVQNWTHQARLFADVTVVETPFKTSHRASTSPDVSESLAFYNAAFAELLRDRSKEQKARQVLRDLMVTLVLGQDQLGRMLGVSGETVRRWERGLNRVPESRAAELLAADAGLRRLARIFRPESLPLVIRRSAEIFDGKRAIDWILDGRIGDVADRYETALTYQG